MISRPCSKGSLDETKVATVLCQLLVHIFGMLPVYRIEAAALGHGQRIVVIVQPHFRLAEARKPARSAGSPSLLIPALQIDQAL